MKNKLITAAVAVLASLSLTSCGAADDTGDTIDDNDRRRHHCGPDHDIGHAAAVHRPGG
ncbi:hypothetical protein RHDE110596_17810 [Prescottella defluvii]|uniref:hypothetical protein n=1 Tax=Prescottella defluvii TaxID=1323361 RepID=UPI000A5A8761|nr:hypothetical protein [Prescottella defluvii]